MSEKLLGLEPPMLFPSKAPMNLKAYHEVNFVGVKPKNKYSINRIENEFNAPVFAPGPLLNGANVPLPFFPRAEKLPQNWSVANRVAYQGLIQGINDDRSAMLSANNMLARGNNAAAELILGRPLTDAEISSKNLFPPVLDPITHRPAGSSSMGQPLTLMNDGLQREAENTRNDIKSAVSQQLQQSITSELAASVSSATQTENPSSSTPTSSNDAGMQTEVPYPSRQQERKPPASFSTDTQTDSPALSSDMGTQSSPSTSDMGIQNSPAGIDVGTQVKTHRRKGHSIETQTDAVSVKEMIEVGTDPHSNSLEVDQLVTDKRRALEDAIKDAEWHSMIGPPQDGVWEPSLHHPTDQTETMDESQSMETQIDLANNKRRQSDHPLQGNQNKKQNTNAKSHLENELKQQQEKQSHSHVSATSQISKGDEGLYTVRAKPSGALPSHGDPMNGPILDGHPIVSPEVSANVVPSQIQDQKNLELQGQMNVAENIQQLSDNMEQKAGESLQQIRNNQPPSLTIPKPSSQRQVSEEANATTAQLVGKTVSLMHDAAVLQEKLSSDATAAGSSRTRQKEIDSVNLKKLIQENIHIFTKAQASRDPHLRILLTAFNSLITEHLHRKGTMRERLETFQLIKRNIKSLYKELTAMSRGQGYHSSLPSDPVANLIPRQEQQQARATDRNLQISAIPDAERAKYEIGQLASSSSSSGNIVQPNADSGWENPLPPASPRLKPTNIPERPTSPAYTQPRDYGMHAVVGSTGVKSEASVETVPKGKQNNIAAAVPVSEPIGRRTRLSSGETLKSKYPNLKGKNTRGSGLMTEIPSSRKNMLQMLRIQMGIVDAGNDSPELLHRMGEILSYGVKRGWVPPELQRAILKHYF